MNFSWQGQKPTRVQERPFAAKKLPCVAMLVLVLAVPSLAADVPQVVRASGEGFVSQQPDQATVTIGVVTQANTADAAAAQNAKQLTAVLDQLRSSLGPQADVRTAGYSLNPNYRYGNNTAPAITGYTASNTVVVKIDELARLGPVIDAATKWGANSIQGIAFSLKDERGARARALALAAQAARSNAEAIAAALSLKVVRVRSAESGESAPIVPMQPQFRAMAADARAPTPVEAGTIEVRATVTVSLEVAQ